MSTAKKRLGAKQRRIQSKIHGPVCVVCGERQPVPGVSCLLRGIHPVVETWKCSMCMNVATGDECEHCGAPRDFMVVPSPREESSK